MTHGLKEFTREYMEMRGESIAQYRIYNNYKVIWTIKGEDLLWMKTCQGEDWEIK